MQASDIPPQTGSDSETQEQEDEDIDLGEIEEPEHAFLKNFWSQFKNTLFESKRNTLILSVFVIIILCVGYFVSVLLSILLFVIALLFALGRWFASTDMSVEITVFLARFFPPSINNVWRTETTPELRWAHVFRDNYKVIHGELLEFLAKYNYCPQFDDVYPNGAITNWDRKWPTVTLRCYGLDNEMCKYFPKTMAIVNQAPVWLSHVMFSILRPHKFIPRHRGPYRGVFRYQLALEIPKCKDPETGLYLCVWPNTSSHEFWPPENVPKGEPTVVTWTEGQDFVFDDTCVHEVHNSTAERRIILFMDVERFDLPFYGKLVHKIFMSAAQYLPTVKYAGNVQDKYLKEFQDKSTQELKKCNTTVDENPILENALKWMWFNMAPEILPFRRARKAIEMQLAARKRRQKQEEQNQNSNSNDTGNNNLRKVNNNKP